MTRGSSSALTQAVHWLQAECRRPSRADRHWHAVATARQQESRVATRGRAVGFRRRGPRHHRTRPTLRHGIPGDDRSRQVGWPAGGRGHCVTWQVGPRSGLSGPSGGCHRAPDVALGRRASGSTGSRRRGAGRPAVARARAVVNAGLPHTQPGHCDIRSYGPATSINSASTLVQCRSVQIMM